MPARYIFNETYQNMEDDDLGCWVEPTAPSAVPSSIAAAASATTIAADQSRTASGTKRSHEEVDNALDTTNKRVEQEPATAAAAAAAAPSASNVSATEYADQREPNRAADTTPVQS